MFSAGKITYGHLEWAQANWSLVADEPPGHLFLYGKPASSSAESGFLDLGECLLRDTTGFSVQNFRVSIQFCSETVFDGQEGTSVFGPVYSEV